MAYKGKDKTNRILGSSVENVVDSANTECMVENAKLSSNAGMKSQLIRETNSETCDWCKSKAGNYNPDNIPTGALGKHDNCDCSIHAETEKRKRELENIRKFIQEQINPLSEDELEQRLEFESESWIAKLTNFQITAIKKYTFNEGDSFEEKLYKRINLYLQEKAEKVRKKLEIILDPTLEKYSSAISESIKKYSLKCDCRVFRGDDYDITMGGKEGDIIVLEQFVSTSISRTGAFKGKKYFFTIIVPKGSDVAYINKLSKFKNQKELLINRGKSYIILDRDGNNVTILLIG